MSLSTKSKQASKKTADYSRFDRWRRCWQQYLLGRHWEPETESGQQIIASMERIADAGDCNVVGEHFVLRALAMAYQTKGTKYYKDKAARDRILTGIERLYETVYHPGMDTGARTDWWNYELGIPLRLLDILYLMYEELPEREAVILKHTDAILSYKDTYLLSSNGMPEDGANLVWKCQVLLLTAILRRDSDLIDWVNGRLPGVLGYARSAEVPGMGRIYPEGFYPDGSFIQHHMFAYTGGYGKHLLNILSGLLYAFDGEECLRLEEKEREFFYRMVHQAYEPLVWGGRFMDLARGREASRPHYPDKVCGRHILRSLCYLVKVMPAEYQNQTIPMLKAWLNAGDTAQALLDDWDVDQEYFVSPSLSEVVSAVKQSPLPARPPLTGHFNFGVVCKALHRRENYALAVSMYGKNIACYERLNTESERFWHVSDGMTYLYTADLDQYNQDYYATADMQRLPGTTVERVPGREDDPYYSWYLPESRSVYSFAGGVTLERFGSAGQRYRGQGRGKERTLEVRKSWFMFDDEIVCMGSGITSPTGYPVETILDNRRLLPQAANLLTFDGEEPAACRDLMDVDIVRTATALHLSSNMGLLSGIGYCFLQPTPVHVLVQHRTGTWGGIHKGPHAGRLCQNDHAVLWLSHGSAPQDAQYAYILLPAKTARETFEYCASPAIAILEQSDLAHAVHHDRLGITALNFWQPAVCAGMTCSGQACVIVRRQGNRLEIAISDPTKENAVLELSTLDQADRILNASPGLTVQSLSPLRLTADTAGQEGQSLYIALQLKD